MTQLSQDKLSLELFKIIFPQLNNIDVFSNQTNIKAKDQGIRFYFFTLF